MFILLIDIVWYLLLNHASVMLIDCAESKNKQNQSLTFKINIKEIKKYKLNTHIPVC